MFEDFVIWGSAGHAKVLASLVLMRGGRVIALFDNREVPPALPDVPLFIGESGFEQWQRATPGRGRVAGLVAIGGHRGRDRLAIQTLFLRHGLQTPVIVHPSAAVGATAELGEGTHVLAQAVVAADARVGRVCIINHCASVDHECTLGDGVHLAPSATLCGCVTLGENVLVGAGAVVLPRIAIGTDAVVGAGAVVTRDVPPGAVVVGNPAQITK